MEPATHGGYAVQWFALSLAAVIIWITLGVRNASAPAKIDRNPENKNET